MKDVTQALDVAIFIRNYLKQNQLTDNQDPKNIDKNHQRIAEQVKGISKI